MAPLLSCGLLQGGTGRALHSRTDAPLDLDNPDHPAALLRAYARFLEIGSRSSP
ncbi:DUF5953 family protein [Pyxidicoccus caerfyrddinensis]|uniref:DUF5953 family protein n=1 Tax=Pyxidicoccus caerfyrddinensis TaxID=2709663 RepID=UPI003B830099